MNRRKNERNKQYNVFVGGREDWGTKLTRRRRARPGYTRFAADRHSSPRAYSGQSISCNAFVTKCPNLLPAAPVRLTRVGTV